MWNNSNIHKKIFTEIKPGSETNKNKKYKTSRRDIGKNGGERKKKIWMDDWLDVYRFGIAGWSGMRLVIFGIK